MSTTTRQPRVGEVEGVDYYFINREQSLLIESANEFIELNDCGERYGVTIAEAAEKISAGTLPAVVILTPNGIETYQKFCDSVGIKLVKLFVNTPQDVLLERLRIRAEKDINAQLSCFIGEVIDDTVREKISKQLGIMLTRTRNILIEEKKWRNYSLEWKYDIIVPGDDIDSAISTVTNFNF